MTNLEVIRKNINANIAVGEYTTSKDKTQDFISYEPFDGGFRFVYIKNNGDRWYVKEVVEGDNIKKMLKVIIKLNPELKV